MEKKTVFALARIGAAALAAVILLACSGWAFVCLLGSPETITQGEELEDGKYVAADVGFIMDICGVERDKKSGEPVAYFAVAPVGDQFVLIRFPAKDYDTYAALESETMGYLYGTQSGFSFHLNVTGMARGLDETSAALLSEWFAENGSWMSRSGLIAAVENYGTYLSGYMIDTGRVGSVTRGAGAAMSVIAAALIVYAAAEAVVLCVRKHEKPEKKYKGVYDA